MADITSVTGTQAGSNQQAAATAASNKAAIMGKDDFLKLLVAQLQHQDPMNPSDNNEFMGQMAQFSALEQMTNISANTGLSQAIGLLGKTVTYTGAVEKIVTVDGATKLTIGGVGGIDPSTITEVSTSSPTQ